MSEKVICPLCAGFADVDVKKADRYRELEETEVRLRQRIIECADEELRLAVRISELQETEARLRQRIIDCADEELRSADRLIATNKSISELEARLDAVEAYACNLPDRYGHPKDKSIVTEIADDLKAALDGTNAK